MQLSFKIIFGEIGIQSITLLEIDISLRKEIKEVKVSRFELRRLIRGVNLLAKLDYIISRDIF